MEGQLVSELTTKILLFFNLDLDVLHRAPLISGGLEKEAERDDKSRPDSRFVFF